jgi:hypothetical protein
MATELDTQHGIVRVPPVRALETGGVLVGDEVRVVADVAAVCASPDATGTAA